MNPGGELSAFGAALLFILGGLIFILGGLFTNSLLSPHRPNPEKLSTYECGEDPVGNARIQFNMRFYVVGLLFLLFDVELIFLFPWGVLFGSASEMQQIAGGGWMLLCEGILFLLILSAGLGYAWLKGYLDWVKPEVKLPATDSPVPASEYERFNRKMAETQSGKP